MQLVSFVAATSQQAMAELRTKLGEDAIIVTTQTMENGDVRITGAISDTDINLIEVLTPEVSQPNSDWLIGLGDFHEFPEKLNMRFASSLTSLAADDPKATLMALVRSIFSFDGLSCRHGPPILVSGPPGSGKTATIAKLAALQVLAEKSVDVLTLDVERAGALEQLTTLLDPLGIRPKVVSKLNDAKSVLASCSSDFVLIDGPGTNPYNPTDLGVLSTLVEQIGAELLLVMEGGRSPSDSVEVGEVYMALGAKRFVATKLDITKRLGGVLAVAEAGLAFCGAGIGPTIGDGFRPLTADGLARLLLCRYDEALIGEGRR